MIELVAKGFIRINTEDYVAYYTPAAPNKVITAGYPLYLTSRQFLTAKTL